MNNRNFHQPDTIPGIDFIPVVSIILSVEPVTTKLQLETRLKSITKKIEEQLLSRYCDEKAVPIILKLQHITTNVSSKNYKNGIAIFVSPFTEQVYPLEGKVKDKIDIEELFEIREEIFKKQTH